MKKLLEEINKVLKEGSEYYTEETEAHAIYMYEKAEALVYRDIDRKDINDTKGLEDLYNYYKEKNEDAAGYIDDNYDEILEYIKKSNW